MRDGIRNKLLATALVAGLIGLTAVSGCTAAARGLGKLTANKTAEARDGTVWLQDVPRLEPPAPEDKTIAIDFRNLSDADEIELRQILIHAAEAKGWKIVSGSENPKFRLRADARFFGEVEPESGGEFQARAMGAISGAAVGIGTYAGARELGAGSTVSAGAGVTAGGLVGLGMFNASQLREWALVIDFLLEERQAEPVTFNVEVSDGSSATTGAGTDGPRRTDGGESTRGTESTAVVAKTSNYLPYGIRLSAWANQMNMKENEALPLIRDNVDRIVKQMLPE